MACDSEELPLPCYLSRGAPGHIWPTGYLCANFFDHNSNGNEFNLSWLIHIKYIAR